MSIQLSRNSLWFKQFLTEYSVCYLCRRYILLLYVLWFHSTKCVSEVHSSGQELKKIKLIRSC